MPTGKAINLSNRKPKGRPKKRGKKRTKKEHALDLIKEFGVTNKFNQLKFEPTSYLPSTTPLGETSRFSLHSLKRSIRRTRAVKRTVMNKVSKVLQATNVKNFKTITQTDKNQIDPLMMITVPEKSINVIQKSPARIVLNPSDLGFYGFNSVLWTPFKTPTYSLAVILETGGNAKGNDLLNVGTLTADTIKTTIVNVEHIYLDYWNPASTLYIDNNIYNVSTLINETISASLYIGNYSSFERVGFSTIISSETLYSLFDVGFSNVYEWNSQLGRKSSGNLQGCGDINPLGELVVASTFTTLNIYDSGNMAYTLTFNSNMDIYIVKYIFDGGLSWANKLAHSADINIQDISTNSNGDIILTGGLNTGTLNIYDIIGLQSTIYYPRNVGYLFKYNTNGLYLWNTTISSNNNNQLCYACSTNDENDIVAVGTFDSNLTVNGAIGVALTLSTSAPNCFLTKWSKFGQVQWVTKFTANIAFNALDMDLAENGDIYITGSNLNSFIRFYSVGNILSTLVIPNYGGGFIAKYDTNGMFQWATYILGGFSSSIKANKTKIAVAGFYQNLLRIYVPGVVAPVTLYSPTRETFLVNFTGQGEYQWLSHIKNSPITETNWLKVDVNVNDNVLLYGNYSTLSSPLYIYPAVGDTVTFPVSNKNSFIVNYNPNGSYNWGSRLSSDVEIRNYSINLKNTNEIYATGTFKSTLNIYDLNGINVVKTLSQFQGNDVFIIKYTPLSNATLETPTIDGQTKIISSSGPLAFISSSPNKFNNTLNKLIVLRANQRAKILWNQYSNNWIIQKNTGQLV